MDIPMVSLILLYFKPVIWIVKSLILVKFVLSSISYMSKYILDNLCAHTF